MSSPHRHRSSVRVPIAGIGSIGRCQWRCGRVGAGRCCQLRSWFAHSYPPSRIRSASRSITVKSAPTAGARVGACHNKSNSYEIKKGHTRRSAWVIPGPPL
ncbi:hypothetical protein ACJW30_05G123500 [Castanea mollissima]